MPSSFRYIFHPRCLAVSVLALVTAARHCDLCDPSPAMTLVTLLCQLPAFSLRAAPRHTLAAGTLARRSAQARLDPPPRTALRRRLVPILHPGRPCAAGSSRSSTPDALAPQARLDPPRGWRAGSAWAPALGSHCGLRGRLRHRRAARSEPIAHALQVSRPTPN